MSLGPAAIYAWLAKKADATKLAGGAFLIAPDLAVTCAHVVREHLGCDVTPEEAPRQPVKLRFPALDLERDADVVAGGWFHSPTEGGAEVLRDVAILRLTTPINDARLTCYPLATTKPRGGAHARICGAGPGWQRHGQQVPAELSMDPNFRGLWELTDRKGHGFQTEQGFSGAPLFDDSMTVVWGMVQQVGEPGTRVTLALGADRLQQALRSARLTLGTGAAAAPGTAAPPADPIPPPDRCLGREPALADLVAALLAPGGSTALVRGLGGIGKTTLTRAAANDPAVIARFGPRRHEAALAAATTAAAMQDAIAGAVGADPKGGLPAIRARLLPGPALLLLDNLETPWEAEPKPVEALLAALATVPGLALMASIRGAESPRSPRWRHRLDLSALPPDATRALFLDIAQDIRPEDPALDPLLAELHGIPLAVELLAWQAEPYSDLRHVRAAWDRLGPSLADGRADPGHRHASLARSIEVSLASPRLGEPGRRLFRLLGALPAGLAPDDEAPLLGEAARDADRQLRAVGLVREREGRLDLLPPLRRHAAAAHPPAPEEQRAWIAHYLALAREQGQQVGQAGGALAAARLGPELANLDAALAQAAPAGLLTQADAAIRGYGLLGLLLGVGGAGLRALARACRAAGNRLGEAACLECLAQIALTRSEHDAARQGFDAALASYRDVGDRLGEADCICGLADIRRARDEHDAARQGYDAALAIYRDIGSRLGEAYCIRSLADIALTRSEHDAGGRATTRPWPSTATSATASARPTVCEASPTSRAPAPSTTRRGRATTRPWPSTATSAAASARPTAFEASPTSRAPAPSTTRRGRATTRPWSSAATSATASARPNCLLGLADIARDRADHDAARQGYDAVLAICRDIGDRLGEASCIRSLADIARTRAEHDAARQGYDAALAICREIGDRLGEANCIRGLADIALARSEHDAARQGYDAALAIYRDVGAVVGQAGCIAGQGELAVAQGDKAGARRRLEQAIALYESVGSADGVAWARGLMDRLGP
jgi:tetratricopeptide (TPR) repeat protein